MTDDIVTRLREYNPVRGFIDWADTMTTAADEIEKLRTERDEWYKQAMFWHDQASKLALEEVPQRIRNARTMWNEMDFGND
jgi:hypothetical protein